MTDDSGTDSRPVPGPALPLESSPFAPAEVPEPPAPREREPFWDYSDLLLFAGMVIPCMLAGLALVKVAFAIFRFHPTLKVVELLPEQLIGYVLLFAGFAMALRVQYDRPFWHSLGWAPIRMPFLWIVIAGSATSLGVAFLGTLINTPTTENPMTELLQNRTSAILMAIFGVGIAPLCEELAFRGVLQPLLVRSFGAVPGIIAAAIPFGLLHYREFGNSWRHAILIALAGATFGWMRHATGSVKASTLMHASYNALIFVAVFTQGKEMAR